MGEILAVVVCSSEDEGESVEGAVDGWEGVSDGESDGTRVGVMEGTLVF